MPLTDTPFEFIRIQQPGVVPPAESHAIDIALLDMNHAWPNLGHDSIVSAIREITTYFRSFLTQADLRVRVLSFDIRHGHMIPEGPDRFLLYVGTGGPGHLDPTLNDGLSFSSQGVKEDPAWEPHAFALFDAIAAHPQAALVAICHSFGILCRWRRAAEPRLRSSKSSGVRENVLSEAALAHPWFQGFAAALADHRRFRIVDSRLFDLVPTGESRDWTPIGYEWRDGGKADAVTMIEFERDSGGVMPRIFGVNHHPEVIDREHALAALSERFERGNLPQEWYEERVRTLTQQIEGEDIERALRLTSQYTFLLPLQFHLARLIRQRRESLGLGGNFDETQLVRTFTEEEEEVGV